MNLNDIETKIYLPNRRKLAGKKELKKCIDDANLIPKLFRGPSIYFHHRALLERVKLPIPEKEEGFLEKKHLEMIYAVLPSWGMHRMGGDAKVCSFEVFQESIQNKSVRDIIMELKRIDDDLSRIKDVKRRNDATIDKINSNVVDKIVELIPKIEASESGTRLVSASKTLHHILPNIVPPIDRRYSLRFMKRNTNINRDEGTLAKIFIEGMIHFFNDKSWQDSLKDVTLIEPKLPIGEIGAFNTSLPKIFDNLIVAYVRSHPAEFPIKQSVE